ncbi:MAG: hypothetical protein QGG64_14395 [Candidatus Latescibacteria bacterium]|jgi:hypothetical protein|nr:hypothetical protein [Candidatus Latescibacterota bacterium]
MQAWWIELAPLNQALYGVAIFFSLLFLWQFLTALIGLSGSVDGMMHDDLNADDVGPDVDNGPHDHGLVAFKLLSIRSVIAFGMLFGWASALHLESGLEMEEAILRGFVWGAAGMALVAYFFYKVQQLTETHNRKLSSCIGNEGEVYIDIPENGAGQIRVMESGAVNYISARGRDGLSITHSTPVRVLRTLDITTVEVEAIQS